MAEWNQLPSQVRELIPGWLMTALSNYRIAGGVLESRGKGPDPLRLFSFFAPRDFEIILADDSVWRGLLVSGYFPFANESDGNAWVLGDPLAPESDVSLVELSAWNGAEPSKSNGLIFGASRLSLLLTNMGVSEASYYESPAGSARGMWHREKPPSNDGE